MICFVKCIHAYLNMKMSFQLFEIRVYAYFLHIFYSLKFYCYETKTQNNTTINPKCPKLPVDSLNSMLIYSLFKFFIRFLFVFWLIQESLKIIFIIFATYKKTIYFWNKSNLEIIFKLGKNLDTRGLRKN